MLVLNIVLVLVGIAIPIGATIFWSSVKKSMTDRFDSKKHDRVILNKSSHNLAHWAYHHRSKFNIIITMIVTVIEFFALVQF